MVIKKEQVVSIWNFFREKLNKVYTARVTIFIALSVLLLAWQLITDVLEDKILFTPFTVPSVMEKQGINGISMVGKVSDRINMILEVVKRSDQQQFINISYKLDIEVEADTKIPGTELSLKDITDFLRMFLGTSVRKISGYFSVFREKQCLSIRILDGSEKTFSAPLGEISDLTNQAAEYILMVLDPFTLGKYYFIQKDADAMKKLVTFIRTRTPTDKEMLIAYLINGLRFFESGEYKSAWEQWEFAQDINSKNINAIIYQGWALNEMEEYSEAINNYKKVLELDPDNFDAINNLGISFYNMGEKEKAIREFKKLIRINPEYSHGYNNLGFILLEMGEYEEGIAYIRKAIRLNPNDPEFYRSLGDGLFATGKYTQAMEQFRMVLEFLPEDTLSYMLWGKCLEKLGKKEEAEEKYKKFRHFSVGKSQE